MPRKFAHYDIARYAIRAIATTLICSSMIGCGGNAPTADSNTTPATSRIAANATPLPTDIVSQFLDQVRRGGEDSGAGALLTQLAQSELKRIGRSVQPIGSPDASFNVTRGEAVPDDPNAMLVHSIWSEPNNEGSQSNYQVVWALQREPVGWRISGLAMEFEPGMDPEIINFEDGNAMMQILGGGEMTQSEAAAPSQAGIPSGTTTR